MLILLNLEKYPILIQTLTQFVKTKKNALALFAKKHVSFDFYHSFRRRVPNGESLETSSADKISCSPETNCTEIAPFKKGILYMKVIGWEK